LLWRLRYQCTVHGGREARDVDVHQLVTVCELLGAGEILLNCIDKDGTNSGFDIDLINDVKKSVGIPVIGGHFPSKLASSIRPGFFFFFFFFLFKV
jgi:imidazole glycerol phosphate synthase subunit HisF